MTSHLGPERALRESLPVAVVVVLWSSVAWFVGALGGSQAVVDGLGYAGFVLGGLYAVGVGYDLAGAVPAGVATADTAAVLRQSLGVLAPAGVWFGLALSVDVLADLWSQFGLPGLFTSPAPALSVALAAAGVLTVVTQVVTLAATTLLDAETVDPAVRDRPAEATDA
jgi:hypothetical protein